MNTKANSGTGFGIHSSEAKTVKRRKQRKSDDESGESGLDAGRASSGKARGGAEHGTVYGGGDGL